MTKYGAVKKPPPEEVSPAEPPEMITLIHPDLMDIELVEEAYELSHGTTDEQILDWRSKAWRTIFNRRGKPPEQFPG